jgi:murein L,D-transpeptidase YcbB/YkuD
MLKATIEKNTEDAAQLAKEIAQHDADVAAWEGDKKAATKVRQLEKADYEALHIDYTESVDALQRAIAYLKKKSRTVKQASLAQVKEIQDLKSLILIPDSAKRAIDLFIQEDPVDAQATDSLSVAAPEANAYETNLGGVIEMLEKLLDKFIDERTEVEKEEMNKKHAFEMLVQDLEAQIKQGNADREEKSVRKSKKLQAKADAEGDLTDTTTTRDEDHKFLIELEGTCAQKAADFETRQQLRAEELEAVAKAIEILKGDNIQKLSDKYQSFAQGSHSR